MVDQDQQWLINCLNATLDTNHQVRSFAEASLNQASLQPGSSLLPHLSPISLLYLLLLVEFLPSNYFLVAGLIII